MLGTSVKTFSSQSSTLGSDFQDIYLQLNPASSDEPRIIELAYQGVLLPQPMDNKINQVTANIVELNVDSFWLPIDLGFNKTLKASLTLKQKSGLDSC